MTFQLQYKGACQKKKYGIFGSFSQMSDPSPPPPLFGRPPSKKKFEGLFCVLGPKEHFWFLQKCSLFVSILTYTFGNRGPPPPSRKNSQIISFLPVFFPDLTDQDPKSNYLKVIKLIRYHLPPIVKHVLAPQNDFGMPKITWSNHKSFGIEETPPPYVGKNSQIIPYFFSEAFPNRKRCARKRGWGHTAANGRHCDDDCSDLIIFGIFF